MLTNPGQTVLTKLLARPRRWLRRRRTIAAVCASSLSHNTGMITVDLAVMCVAHELGLKVDLLTVETPHVVSNRLRYRALESQQQLKRYRRVLFWGDFLHARPYHTGDLTHRWESRGLSPDLVENTKAFPLLLLEGAPVSLLGKSIAFGGTIYINGPHDDADQRYRAAIERLYNGARLVLLRDPISAQYASRYMKSLHPLDTLGIDAAFLLRPFGRYAWRKTSTQNPLSRRRLGFSFGRRLAKDETSKTTMTDFTSRLAAFAGYEEVVDLAWLKRNRADPLQGVMDKLAAIRSCQLVITDTYHCAVNCWREGVPAICIGVGAETPSVPLSEKKKELLYMMFNMKDFYIYFESILENPDEVLRRAAQVSLNDDLIASIMANIAASTERARMRLYNAILH